MNEVNADNFDDEALDLFLVLDDIDILSSVKQWQFHGDPILSRLSQNLLNRKLPKVMISNKDISEIKVAEAAQKASDIFEVSEMDALRYFVKTVKKSNITPHVHGFNDSQNFPHLKFTYYVIYILIY